MERRLHDGLAGIRATLAPRVAMLNDDRWALRAELEARKKEIATLRGVVAVLRESSLSIRAGRTESAARDRPIRSFVLATCVGTVLGFALALVVLRCLSVTAVH
jgi:hypothetical protein